MIRKMLVLAAAIAMPSAAMAGGAIGTAIRAIASAEATDPMPLREIFIVYS